MDRWGRGWEGKREDKCREGKGREKKIVECTLTEVLIFNIFICNADTPFQEGLVVGNWFVGNVVYTVNYFIV